MIPFFILLLSVVFFRIAPQLADNETLRWISGFSPLMALALCGGAFLPRKWAFTAAIAAVTVPYFVVNAVHGYPLFGVFLPVLIICVAVTAAAGVATGKKAKLPVFLGIALLNTVLFHLVTNTVSFFTDPGYVDRSFTGWLQAQTLGLPAWAAVAPAWSFLVKQLAGDLLFTTAFWFACRPAAAASREISEAVSARRAALSVSPRPAG